MKQHLLLFSIMSSMSFFPLISNVNAADQRVEAHEFAAGDFDTVRMSIDGGEVLIAPSQNDVTSSLSYVPKVPGRCPVTVRVADRTLHVDCHKQPGSNEDCIVDFKLAMQASNDITLNSGSSMLRVDGMSGSVDASIGSGTIETTSALSSLKLKLGSGQFSVFYPFIPK